VPSLYRRVRATMIDVLETDYIQMARLKGVPKGLIARRHALPNAAVPTVQASGLVIGYLLSGTILVEYIFRFPGLGTTLAEAVGNRDIPLIQAVTLIYAGATVIFSLVTDVVSFLLSPRARTAQR
jgi:peptide/nickel transport system permease protein